MATTLGVSRLVRVGTDLKSHVLLLSGDLNGAEALSRQAMAEAESAGAKHELALYRLSYTAVLLGNTAVPIWSESRRSLPFLFLRSLAMARYSS